MEDTDKALTYAVRVLARRDHSVAELERKLKGRNFSTVVTAAVVARLEKSGYLDDQRFAERWADAAVRNGRGYGPRLRQELTRRGVSREIVAEVLDGIALVYGEEETLADLLARKFVGFDPLTVSDRDKRRVIAYLQRRGFSSGAIFQLFRATDRCRNSFE